MLGGAQRLNILHLRASNFYGGPERQLHLHALHARACPYNITIGSFTEGGQWPELLRAASRDGIDTHCFRVKGAYDLRAVSYLKDFLLSKRIDIVCTHDYRSQVLAFLARMRTRVKWISFSRGFTSENLKVRLYQELERFLVRFSDHIVAVSESQRQKLVKGKISAGKISVVHNAIDSNIFDEVEAVDLRQRFRFAPDALVCVVAGRFSPEKGQMHLLRAADDAIHLNSRLRFLLYGDGPDLKKVCTRVKQLGLEDKIICPGFEKEMLACVKGADLLVNPSLSEGLPNVVLEAMALKIPVVATAVGGVPEVITSGKNGVLVPADSHLALTQAIIDLVEHRPQMEKLAEAGFETVRELFSFESQMRRLSTVYETVAGRGRP
jgi:glycosyltransferase involved in cell wall biosynthesis